MPSSRDSGLAAIARMEGSSSSGGSGAGAAVRTLMQRRSLLFFYKNNYILSYLILFPLISSSPIWQWTLAAQRAGIDQHHHHKRTTKPRLTCVSVIHAPGPPHVHSYHQNFIYFYIKKIQVQRSSSDDQKDCCSSSKLAQAMLNPDLPNAFRGQYQPIKRLGQGNFGTCWVVHDVRDVGTTRKTPE